jgi:hypothetical protein
MYRDRGIEISPATGTRIGDTDIISYMSKDRGMETALAIGTDTEGQRHHQLQVQGQRKETSPALSIHNLHTYICTYACPGLQYNEIHVVL